MEDNIKEKDPQVDDVESEELKKEKIFHEKLKSKIKQLHIQKETANPEEVEMAKKFYEKVKSGEITHGVSIFRLKDGSINYQAYNSQHFTYIMGLIERTKMFMMEDYHNKNLE